MQLISIKKTKNRLGMPQIRTTPTMSKDKIKSKIRRKGTICVILLLLSILVFNLRILIPSENTITEEDRTSFCWIRENTEKDAMILTDCAHSMWIPYLTDRRTLTGKELSDFRDNTVYRDAATIFATTNLSLSLTLLSKYHVNYIYFSNHSEKNFPITCDEDLFGKEPAILLWKNASKGISKFENSCFRVVYEKKSQEDNILLYENLC